MTEDDTRSTREGVRDEVRVTPVGVAPDLDPDALEAPLETTVLGRAFQVWQSVSSTNDLALKAATVRANEGLVIVADAQSAGRGQRGRGWVAPRGSAVLMSVVLFPKPPLDQPEALVTVTAVAVARALAPFVDIAPQIKWPNDLYLADRKVGGILVERNVGTVIGIGLNVHAAPPDDAETRATSLAAHALETPNRASLIRAILIALERACAEALAGELPRLIAEWKRRVVWLGEQVRVESTQGVLEGTLVDLDPTAGLTLRTAEEGVTFLPAGGVLRMRLSGDGGGPVLP
jgi:BirA family transcriptional regulator, biotin operon repressor / biotin---[acetyl-CoA-carboxylase] ligase